MQHQTTQEQQQRLDHLDGLVQLLATTDVVLHEAEQALADAEQDPQVREWQRLIEAKLEPRREAVKRLRAERDDLRVEAIIAAEQTGEDQPHAALIPKTYTDFELPGDEALRAWLIVHMPGLLKLPTRNDYTIMRRAVHDSKRLSRLFPAMPGTPVLRHTFDLKRDLSQWLPKGQGDDKETTADAEAPDAEAAEVS